MRRTALVAALAGRRRRSWSPSPSPGLVERPRRSPARPADLRETAVTPAAAHFGDTLTAGAVVTVDPRRVDPDTVRLATRFLSYRVADSTTSSGTPAGRRRSTWSYTSRMPRQPAARPGARRSCSTSRPRCSATRPPRGPRVGCDSSGRRSPSRRGSTTRTARRRYAHLRADATPPAVTYDVAPGALVDGLLAGAALLVLAASALLWFGFRRRPTAAPAVAASAPGSSDREGIPARPRDRRQRPRPGAPPTRAAAARPRVARRGPACARRRRRPPRVVGRSAVSGGRERARRPGRARGERLVIRPRSPSPTRPPSARPSRGRPSSGSASPLALLVTLAAAFLLARSPRPPATRSFPPARARSSCSTCPGARRPTIARSARRSAGSPPRIAGSGSSCSRTRPTRCSRRARPARELRPLLRFFQGPKSRRAASPWASSLSGGTRVSAALLLGARGAPPRRRSRTARSCSSATSATRRTTARL